jgi:hypothetical protein
LDGWVGVVEGELEEVGAVGALGELGAGADLEIGQ